ncbi:hypothetical protein Pfo_003376 [Paulownia fortunei]|nr:hypothetical protein Pfo_003376 [Paulownia fortunei]
MDDPSSSSEGGDTLLTADDLWLLREGLSLPSRYTFLLPRSGDRVTRPPGGFFTVYLAYFTSGFTIPPHPLLIEIMKSVGLSVSQLTPNDMLYFEGFLHRLGELELSVSLDAFHTLFTLRRVPHESFFYFYPRAGCRFLDSGPSNRGPWRERGFFMFKIRGGVAYRME